MSQYSDKMASAALRHVQDAATLTNGPKPSPDQAWHLLGFGPECSLKAGLSAEWQGKAIGHAGALSPRLASWLLDLDPAAHRRTQVHAAENPMPEWSPNHRYEATGWLATTTHDLGAALADATALVERRLASLWTAGDLDAHVLKTLP